MRAVLVWILLPGMVLLLAAMVNRSKWIPWSRERKLSWSDFQGKLDSAIYQSSFSEQRVRRGDTLIHTRIESEAYCYHSISLDSEHRHDSVIYKITTYFDPEQSWSKTTSEYVLNHEQRHFDLAEVSAREFRRFLLDSTQQSKAMGEKKTFNLFASRNIQRQHQYDSITRHGIDTDQQLSFNHWIDSSLMALEPYSLVRVAVASANKTHHLPGKPAQSRPVQRIRR